MSTCRDVVTRSLRWLGVSGTGRRVPSAIQASEGMEDLQALYLDIIDRSADLSEVIITAAYEAGENERITGAFAVTYPVTITDQDTQQARPPREFAVVRHAGATPTTKVYDGDLASWVQIESLTLDSAAPWSSSLGQGLSAMLAVAMADAYGMTVPPVCAGLAAQTDLRLSARLQMSGQDRGSVFFQPDRTRDF